MLLEMLLEKAWQNGEVTFGDRATSSMLLYNCITV